MNRIPPATDPMTDARAPTRPTAPRLFVRGLNHLHTPLDVLERFALTPERTAEVLRRLTAAGGLDQALVLSTCNRTEIYAFGAGPETKCHLEEAFLHIAGGAPGPRPAFYELSDGDAARHLFAVDAGLDSLIVGENQIKQQLREAYAISRRVGADGPDLHQLIEAAHRCGKRIRTETDLNVGTLCVGKAAVLKAEQELGSLRGRVCMVIGAGKIGRRAARAIAERGPGRIWIVNRTRENAAAIAGEIGGEAYGMEDLACLLPETEFALGAAYAPELILRRDVYEAACPPDRRPSRVLMVDTAVPRILDPELARVGGVELCDLEHMEEVVGANRTRRMRAAEVAWRIVEEEVARYRAERRARMLGPAIKRLARRFDELFAEAAEHAAPIDDVGRETQRRLKQRLLHEAIEELKRQAEPDA